MSEITHDVSWRCGDRRNSSAEANVGALNPSDLTSRFVASRMNSSSSTIETIGILGKRCFLHGCETDESPLLSHPLPNCGAPRTRWKVIHRYVDRTATSLFAAANRQNLGHPHQIRQRSGRHLFHDVATVDLHGDLSEFRFGGDLLIHEPCCDKDHHLALAGGQRFKARS